MWDAVRRELTSLEWGAVPEDAGRGPLAEGAATLGTLLAARRALAPLTDPEDPFAVMATLTRGAVSAGVRDVVPPGPSLGPLRDAVRQVAASADRADAAGRPGQLATLTQVAYEVAHWTRVRVPQQEPAHAWLLAAETALDGALHAAPVNRTPLVRALAGWQRALAEVQARPEPVFRRGAAVGHLAILKSAHTTLADATRRGVLPEAFGQSVLAAIRQLGRAHEAALAAGRGTAEPSKADQLLMLGLGRTVKDVTADRTGEHLPSRVDALLRSTIGDAPLVAALTGEPAARRAADSLQRLTLEHLSRPQLREPTAEPAPDRTPAPTPAARPAAPAASEPVWATIAPGTVLAPEQVVALCRARDLGAAAATGDPSRPPELLRGTDPATWTQLAQAGRQALADLVASVTPMVYAHARRGPNIEDQRAELFVSLVKAARTFDPSRNGGGPWPTYAWRTLQYRLWGGFDAAGVPRSRNVPNPVLLGDREVASSTPGPEAVVVEGVAPALSLIADAVASLPRHLRAPLEASMNGQSSRDIAADLQISPSSAYRRVIEARQLLRDELGDPDTARSATRAFPRWVTSGPLPGGPDAPAPWAAAVDRTPGR
jgi:DNA-directed RNA polymerase specialized sigma24 family protein